RAPAGGPDPAGDVPLGDRGAPRAQGPAAAASGPSDRRQRRGERAGGRVEGVGAARAVRAHRGEDDLVPLARRGEVLDELHLGHVDRVDRAGAAVVDGEARGLARLAGLAGDGLAELADLGDALGGKREDQYVVPQPGRAPDGGLDVDGLDA
ncbi:MAG: hypothetical protein ACK559_25865, partial [bacterium]